MNRNNSRTYQMLTHVVDFGKRNVSGLHENSEVLNILNMLETAVAILSKQAGIWVAAQTATRNGLAAKQDARENLKKYVFRAVRLSRVLEVDTVQVPGNASDGRLIVSGKAFLLLADSVKKNFVEHGLPGNFDKELASAVQDFEHAIQDHRDARGRVAATRETWKGALREAMKAVAHVDFLVANIFENDPAMLQAYAIARALPQAGRKKSEEEPPPGASTAAA
jgi:hypothetical protein